MGGNRPGQGSGGFRAGAFVLPGLITLGLLLAWIFFGLRLSVVFLLCFAGTLVLWTALSQFLPVMWITKFRGPEEENDE
jgi:hypothetical protein